MPLTLEGLPHCGFSMEGMGGGQESPPPSRLTYCPSQPIRSRGQDSLDPCQGFRSSGATNKGSGLDVSPPGLKLVKDATFGGLRVSRGGQMDRRARPAGRPASLRAQEAAQPQSAPLLSELTT